MSTLITSLAQATENAAKAEAFTISPIGLVIMILAIGGMCSLLGWCVYKVVTVPHPEEHLHTQADITPPDEIEERQ
ncbi:hypothetical protein JD969_17315 [Planctomycetota bacterium]|nr:hypothetical protein JD969_17315 [Planctomycetota bacterium]